MRSPTMTSTRPTAILVGLMFLTATVTFIIADALINGALDGEDYLTGASAHSNALAAGALFAFVQGLAVVGIAVLMYPLLKSHSEPLALGYVALRVAEFTATLIYMASPLLVLVIGDGLRDGTVIASASQSLGPLLKAWHDVAIVLIYVVTGVNGGILAFLFYRTKLIPRPMAILGLIGYPVLLLGGILDMFGVSEVTQGLGLLSLVPGGLYEVILPIWLIAKGFTASSPDRGHVAVIA